MDPHLLEDLVSKNHHPKDHWTLKTGYFEDPNPAIQVQTLPLEGPRSLGHWKSTTQKAHSSHRFRVEEKWSKAPDPFGKNKWFCWWSSNPTWKGLGLPPLEGSGPSFRTIWVFPKNRGTPKWMVKIMENPIKMDDLGVPLFSETSMCSSSLLECQCTVKYQNCEFHCWHKTCPTSHIRFTRKSFQLYLKWPFLGKLKKNS